MWISVGYGTLIGAVIGLAIPIIIISIMYLRVWLSLYAFSDSFDAKSENGRKITVLAFRVQEIEMGFERDPLGITFTYLGIPVLFFATIGLIIDNILRLF